MTGVVVSVHKTGIEVKLDEVVFCLNKCSELPVVNDNVLLEKREDKYFVMEVLPRRNLIARYDFYKERHQGFAANIDTVFVVTSATKEFSMNRIRRFLALCGDVRKVVVVTKVDIGSAPKIPGVEQVNINALNPNDVTKLKWKGTALMMGSSGVGKSTILNTLCGLNLKTREVSGDKGKHTTSARTMYFLDDGRRIIDTPGVRIVGVEGENTETRRARVRKNRLTSS